MKAYIKQDSKKEKEDCDYQDVTSLFPSIKTMKIEIKDFKCPSMNASYAGRHWTKRKKQTDEIHELVYYACYEQKTKPVKKYPVTLSFDVYYKDKRRRDIDNLSVKEIIDGLVRAGIIKDDCDKYVKEIRKRIIRGDDNKVVIKIIK